MFDPLVVLVTAGFVVAAVCSLWLKIWEFTMFVTSGALMCLYCMPANQHIPAGRIDRLLAQGRQPARTGRHSAGVACP
jgi:hypothetical protein